MSPLAWGPVGESLAALVLVTGLFAAGSKRAETRLRIYLVQSIALAGWLLLSGIRAAAWPLALLGLLAVPLKAVLLPRLLSVAADPRRVKTDRHDGPGGALSLLAAGALAAAARYATSRLAPSALPEHDAFAAGLSTLLAGMFLIAARRRLRSQLLGLLIAENGAALAAAAAAPALGEVAGLLLGAELALLGLVLALRLPAFAELAAAANGIDAPGEGA